MKKNPFIHEDFLLDNKYSKELYHDHVSKLPIIDYHCHLSPKLIAEDAIFEDITQAWIEGDHYKWRAMRTLGVTNLFITGNASNLEKFKKWAYTVPFTIRNPLYHWTHLELARYFEIYELLTESNAEAVYHKTSGQLNCPSHSCQNLISRMNVEVLCTTDDPIDDLKYHAEFHLNGTRMSTSFRPDEIVSIESPCYLGYLNRLEEASGIDISNYSQLCDALKNRLEYFHQAGCRLSDHGLNKLHHVEFTETEIERTFQKKRKGKELKELECQQYHSAIMMFLAEQYHHYGWVQQFHLGALRNNNHRMLEDLGPNTGWDSIGDYPQAASLATFLDRLNRNGKLTRTILYNSNPADNEVMASMIGNFNEGEVKGKIQFGSAWWFLDQKDGIIKQINALSNLGLLSCFVGMITDSRSFLSFPRHEYFRRILCNLLGKEIHQGELPMDIPWIAKIASDICYYNSKEYFGF